MGQKAHCRCAKRISEASTYATSRPSAEVPTLAPETDNGVTSPMLASINDDWAFDWGADDASGELTTMRAQAVMDRVLNLAARYAVGNINDKVVDVYSKNTKSDQCLSMAKLTLTQCIAATRTPYEEAFCLGEHGLNDIGSCVGWVAGAN